MVKDTLLIKLPWDKIRISLEESQGTQCTGRDY